MGEKSTLPHVILSGSNTTWHSIMIEYAHDLSDHRFNKGKDALRQAELLLKNKEYDGVALAFGFTII